MNWLDIVHRHRTDVEWDGERYTVGLDFPGSRTLIISMNDALSCQHIRRMLDRVCLENATRLPAVTGSDDPKEWRNYIFPHLRTRARDGRWENEESIGGYSTSFDRGVIEKYDTLLERLCAANREIVELSLDEGMEL